MKEDRLLKMASVLEYVQVSKSKLYEMMAEGQFPKPQTIGIGSKLWLLSDIQNWINEFKTKKEKIAS